jgi:hypothetical protein
LYIKAMFGNGRKNAGGFYEKNIAGIYFVVPD